MSRARVVHFTHSYMETSFGIVRLKKYGMTTFPDWQFLNPLSNSLKIALLIGTFVSLLIILILENSTSKFEKRERIKYRESLAYIFGLAFQRDMGGTNPRMWSGRIVALGYASAMTIIMSIYTARITANSIKQVVIDDFKGFQDEKVISV